MTTTPATPSPQAQAVAEPMRERIQKLQAMAAAMRPLLIEALGNGTFPNGWPGFVPLADAALHALELRALAASQAEPAPVVEAVAYVVDWADIGEGEARSMFYSDNAKQHMQGAVDYAKTMIPPRSAKVTPLFIAAQPIPAAAPVAGEAVKLDAPDEELCEKLAALGWQKVVCGMCGHDGARGYPRAAQVTQAAVGAMRLPLLDPRMEKFDQDGMIAAFELKYGQCWTNKDWRNETATWAAAWRASRAQPPIAAPAGDDRSREGGDDPDKDLSAYERWHGI